LSSYLKNKVIVITRTNEQSSDSVKKLESLGAKVIPFPTIKIVPIKVFNHFDTYAEKLNNFDYIVFTSENAVKYSADRLKEIGKVIPDNVKVVCTGSKTADKCDDCNINVDIIPDDFSAKGLLEHFSTKNLVEKKFFIPSSEIARDELKMGLLELGAEVVQTPVYDVALPDEEENRKNIELISRNKPDLFIYTSPSTFHNFLKILEIDNPVSYFRNYDVAAIGPTTTQAIENEEVKVSIVPKSFTMDGLIDAIINYYSENETT